MKKLVFLCSLLVYCTTLSADWDPGRCLTAQETTRLSELNDRRFKQMKMIIKKQLKNSWCSEEKTNLLMDIVLLTQPRVCVEIGAFTGSSVLPVAATLKYLQKGKIFAIDAWSTNTAVRHFDNDDPNKAWWATINMDNAYAQFESLRHTWDLENYCTAIRLPSNEAVHQVPDEIDFLHMDGDFSEKGALEDVQLYLPKVKSGGYILFSNLYTMLKNKQTKLKAFCALAEASEVVAEIENENVLLLRKN